MKLPSDQHLAELESAVRSRIGFDPRSVGDQALLQALRQQMTKGKVSDGDSYVARLLLDEVDEWQHPSSILYYYTADLQGTYQALVQKGVEFKEKPHLVARMPNHELWMAFFKDPSGNTLALMSEIPNES